jgi:Holliday junction resolvase
MNEILSAGARARLLYGALDQLGWQEDKEALVKLINRLRLGLPSEDEFLVVLAWLGKCRMVHKLDQLQLPEGSRATYRIPDLLAVFQQDGRHYPVLIEVKAKEKTPLSWRKDFYEALQRYGELLNLPVLVAWKYATFWALFELKHFERPSKNYRISFESAMKQNLMGLLAGDFSFSMNEGVGLHMRMRKIKNETSENGKEGWVIEIEGVYFTNSKGECVKEVPGLLNLFICSEQNMELIDEGTHFVQNYVIPKSNTAEFASRALTILLETFKGGDNINWRDLMHTDFLSKRCGELRKAAEDALKSGFVHHILNQVPHDRPGFLEALLTKNMQRDK